MCNSKGEAKLILFVYALMSSRRQCDYEAVFRELQQALGRRDLVLAAEGVLADYELAVWNAVAAVFNIPVHGCAFHWAMAVQRKCQQYGLEAAARQDKNLEADMQQLKQMQFLGHNHITGYFNAMTAKHSNLDPRQPMACLLRYFDRQWIHGKFPPSTWSQFKVTIRSNNGVEGWHKSFNVLVGKTPHLYSFIASIASDAQSHCDDIAAQDFHRPCRPKQARREKSLQDLQKRYEEETLGISEYLLKCAAIYRPKKFAA